MRALAVLVLAFLLPGVAQAGALAKVIDGLGQATGHTGDNTAAGGGDVWGALVNGLLHPDAWASWQANPVLVPGSYAYPPPTSSGPAAEGYLYLGVQSVHDSNNSATLELRASYGDFGIDLRGTSFFEDPDLRLDLGSVGPAFRVIRDGRLELWLEAGFAGINSQSDVSVFGALAGLRVEDRIAGEIGAAATARYFLLSSGVRVIEAMATFEASVLRLSYRMVKLNVGPPLHGPELGLALTF